ATGKAGTTHRAGPAGADPGVHLRTIPSSPPAPAAPENRKSPRRFSPPVSFPPESGEAKRTSRVVGARAARLSPGGCPCRLGRREQRKGANHARGPRPPGGDRSLTTRDRLPTGPRAPGGAPGRPARGPPPGDGPPLPPRAPLRPAV